MTSLLSRRIHDLRDRPGEFFPARGLAAQMGTTGASERIEPRSSIIRRGAPFGGDPTLLKKALQRGIQRTMVDAQNVVGTSLDGASDSVTMNRPKNKGLENEHVESSLH